MSVLIVGLILFIGIHSVSIVNAGWRDDVAARMGCLLYTSDAADDASSV